MEFPNELALWILKEKEDYWTSPDVNPIQLPYVYIYRINKKLCLIEGAYPDGNIASGKIFQSFYTTKEDYLENDRYELIVYNPEQNEQKFKNFLQSIRQPNNNQQAQQVAQSSPISTDEDPSSEDSEEPSE
jgi:hypothetical protein